MREDWGLAESVAGYAAFQAQEVYKGRGVHIWPFYPFTFDYGGWSWCWNKEAYLYSLFRKRRQVVNWNMRPRGVGYGFDPWEEHIEMAREYAAWLEFLHQYAANEATDEELRTHPFFVRRSRYSPRGIMALYGGTSPEVKAAAAAFIEANLPELLARMIPAITAPAGSRPVAQVGEKGNLDLERFQTHPWPRRGRPDERPRWLHRDHRRLAYVYVNQFYRHLTGKNVFNIQWKEETDPR